MRWTRGESSAKLVEAIQTLLAEGTSVDVRVRCKDHQPSDGLGAHKLVLAAASPTFLKEAILDVAASDEELLCLHLPDYTSLEIGPVMSLLYYGEIWLSNSYATVCQAILDDLQIAVRLVQDSSYLLLPRHMEKECAVVKREAFCKRELVEDEPKRKVNLKRELEEDNEDERQSKCKKELAVEKRQQTVQSIKLEPPDSDEEPLTLSSTPQSELNDSRVVKVPCTEPGCSYVTSSLSSLQTHRLVHWRRNNRLAAKRTCPVCKQVCDSPKEARKHGLETHAETFEENKAVACIVEETCNWKGSLDNSDVLQLFFQHILSKHNSSSASLKEEQSSEESELLACDVPNCGYVTTKSFNLAQHLRHHNDERRYECPICNKRFRTSSHLRTHTRAVHTKEKAFQCPDCSRGFATQWQCKSHFRTHHGQKKTSYDCVHCDKSFAKPQSLAGHIKSAHGSEKKKKLWSMCETCGLKLTANHQCCDPEAKTKCQLCNKDISAKSVKAHRQYHKRKETEAHLCHYCNKSFTTETSLKRHVLIHNNSKPFQCSVCEKTFRQKGSLVSHSRVHSGLRVSCVVCSKKFITKSLLNQHIKAKRACREKLGQAA